MRQSVVKMILSHPPLIVGALLFCLILYTWCVFASPLRKVPGPAYTLVTSWILKWHEFHASRTWYIHRLHLKYGPVVRIAPNEVSFTSAAAIKEIYCSGGSGYDKTEFYNLFQVFGQRTMFSTLNRNDHAKRKRVLADRYANTNIMRSASLEGIKERSRRFTERCSTSVDGQIDLFVTLHAYAFDCITHHLFHPYGSDSLRVERDEEVMRQVTDDNSLQNRLLKYYSPTLHRATENILRLFASPRETPLADDLVRRATSKDDPEPFTLLSRMQEKAHDMEKVEMAAECLDHMAAGIDTTGDALCFLIWEISQPRSSHVQRRLQEELRAKPDVPFDKLSYLDAVVHEGLRCFPAIPMSLPRYVPGGGRIIDGFSIPGKTIVSCQAYSTHRREQQVFPCPDLFEPDRWLEASGDLERRHSFFAFASGGRGCVGKHLALAEMKVLLRDLYSRYTTVPDGAMREEMMEMSDQLISSQPRGKKCIMRLLPIGQDAGTEGSSSNSPLY